MFEPETYRTISKKDNLIAFVFEIPLLLRVLKAAGNNAADSLEVKLAMRTYSSGPSTQPVSRPYLTFASKGHNLNMTQDLPVSKPYTAGRKFMVLRKPALKAAYSLHAVWFICSYISCATLHVSFTCLQRCRRQRRYIVIPKYRAPLRKGSCCRDR